MEKETESLLGYKVSDLGERSTKTVLVKCDYCGKQMGKQYGRILRGRRL